MAGPFVRDMAARTKLTVLGFADPGGFHVRTNLDRPITDPDDMWDLRLRAIPGFAPLGAMITAVNARPVQVSSRDELSMLSMGAIEGQMSPPPTPWPLAARQWMPSTRPNAGASVWPNA